MPSAGVHADACHVSQPTEDSGAEMSQADCEVDVVDMQKFQRCHLFAKLEFTSEDSLSPEDYSAKSR